MKKTKTKINIDLKFWLTFCLLIVLGLFFSFMIGGHSFLGFISFCLAALLTCYKLLSLLGRKYTKAAKILRRALNTCVAIGLIIVFITGCIVGYASLGAADTDCQYVVVLGCGIRGTTPSLSLQERLDAAYSYLTAHPNAICVLSGGQGPGEDITEAECMYTVLTGKGIDPSRLWMENRSTSTEENLRFSLDLIEAQTGARPAEIGVVSSSYHLFRAGLFAKDEGTHAIGIPAQTVHLTRFVNYFLREIAGVWHYIVFGG